MNDQHAQDDKPSASSIAILGAGVVGLSTAYWLQRAGFAVTLFDSEPPGSGASFGNAGLFADYGRLPFANFGMLRKMPGMLLDKMSPLAIDPSYSPQLLRFGHNYVKACFSGRYVRAREGLYNLHSLAREADDAIIDATGSRDLIRDEGFLGLFSTAQSLQQARDGQLAERARQGVEMRFLDSAQVADMEPGLAMPFAGAVFYPNTRQSIDPLAYCQRLFAHFQAMGGHFVQQRVSKLSATPEQVELRTLQCSYRASRLVVAAGAASRELLKQLHIDITQVCERGYHLMLADSAPALNRPIAWMNQGVHMTPMSQGVRVAGTAEYTHFSAAPSERRQAVMLKHAKQMLGQEIEVASDWVGSRPTTPDSLPVIANSVQQPRVTLAFGHGHLGLTLASVTGKMVAELAAGEATSVDISAFSAERFS
ncbi:MAG: NAD(P)/FAD-dependent oxidoreductase [Pseudomonadales bacterium]